MDEQRKFIEELQVDGWSVKTDTGFKKISQSAKTIQYQIWRITTKNHFLKCADNHIVYKSDYSECFVKDVKVGDVIITETGLEQVICVESTADFESMFDLSVDSEDHRYYTNGILSHNTTIGALKSMRHLVETQDKEKSVNCWKLLKSSSPKQSTKVHMEWSMKIGKKNYYEPCGNTKVY
jgi:hypothetical protein